MDGALQTDDGNLAPAASNLRMCVGLVSVLFPRHCATAAAQHHTKPNVCQHERCTIFGVGYKPGFDTNCLMD